MKKYLGIALFMFCSVLAFSQADGVTIYEDNRIAHYLNEFNRISAQETMPEFIWRVQLISTYERAEANNTRAKFRNLFPSEPSFLQHDGTKFLVRGGEFTSRIDAEVFLQKIKRNFPSSFILPKEKVK